MADSKGDITGKIDATPECGEDFCDSCGDCLHCYGHDECFCNSDGCHFWVEYEHKNGGKDE